MSRPIARLVVALLAAALLASCGGRVPSSLLHPAENPALTRAAGPLSLAVELPIEERPQEERLGLEPKTTAFVFLLFFVYETTRGSLVSGPSELGARPLVDLHKLTLDYLRRSQVFQRVEAAPAAADLVLRARVHHLFAGRYMSTMFMAAVDKDSSDFRDAKAQHAPFGNAVVTYELVDRRGGRESVLWRDTLSGFTAGSPGDHKYRSLPWMATSATKSLLGRLARALNLVNDRLLARERPAPPVVVNEGFRFLVQRTDARREGIDLVTVEFPTGKVVESRRIEADSLPPGRPGDWLLSRRLPDGQLVAGDRYESMARVLASKFDLRRVDDAYYYHFFGLRGRKPPPPPLPPPPPQSSPVPPPMQ